jgi:DNA-binding transcriptional MerR regulator/uncharacterized protein (DUF433 family)
MVSRRMGRNPRPRQTVGDPAVPQPADLRDGDRGLLQVLDAKTYSIAAVARLTGLHPRRVGRWLQGYRYQYEVSAGPARQGEQRPVIQRPRTGGTTYASFLDLVDLLFVREFLKHGLSLQKVRLALDEATRLLGTDHFARQTFFTDGHQIHLELVQAGPEKAKGLLALMTGGQWAIAPLIEQLASRIDFHKQTGLARRWHPSGRDGLVVVDPYISFGRPSIVRRGIATESVYDVYLGEHEQIEAVCHWLGLRPEEAEAAVLFERQMAA